MDYAHENFVGGWIFVNLVLTSSADMKRVPAENEILGEEAFHLPKLTRTRNSTQLGRMCRLDRVYFTSTGDEKTPNLTPSRSSSSSGEEIVFRGRGKHERILGIENVSRALSGLSVEEGEEKNEDSCNDMRSPDTSDTHSTSQDDQSYDSGDVRRLIDPRIRPSPSEDLQAELQNPYPGIDLNEGWNRANLRGVKQFFAEKPSISNNNIRSDFANYSLRAQQLLLPVRPHLEKLFTFVFKSTGPVNKPFHSCRSLVLSRGTLQPLNMSSPATSLPQRNYNLPDYAANFLGQQASLFDPPRATISKICRYLCQLTPQRGPLKRRLQLADLGAGSPYVSVKRHCLRLGGRHVHRHNPHLAPHAERNRLVVDDGWRKRMRSRAIKAGRWTDGTARQDRLWEEFFWVLDGVVEGPPLDQKRAFSV